MTRMQDFLLWEEADISAIEYKHDEDLAIKIDHSNFYWGFDEHEEAKNVKIKKRKLQQFSENLEVSHTSKCFYLINSLICLIKEGK